MLTDFNVRGVTPKAGDEQRVFAPTARQLLSDGRLTAGGSMHDKTYRVIVVDDNHDSATTMGQLLALLGFEVETFFDGPAALKAVEGFRPDACVLDINMPGMTGYELAECIRGLYPDRPPVFATMTAYEDYAHLEKAVAAGFDLQFTKPVDPGSMAEQLEASVRKGVPEDDRSVIHRLLARVFGEWSKRGVK